MLCFHMCYHKLSLQLYDKIIAALRKFCDAFVALHLRRVFIISGTLYSIFSDWHFCQTLFPPLTGNHTHYWSGYVSECVTHISKCKWMHHQVTYDMILICWSCPLGPTEIADSPLTCDWLSHCLKNQCKLIKINEDDYENRFFILMSLFL